MKKVIPISLIAALLIQSCVIYQKTPVALEEAVERGKVMVITDSNEKLKFKKILFVNDSLYVGVINNSEKINLNEDIIRRVYLKSENSSDLATVGLVLLTGIICSGILLMVAINSIYNSN